MSSLDALIAKHNSSSRALFTKLVTNPILPTSTNQKISQEDLVASPTLAYLASSVANATARVSRLETLQHSIENRAMSLASYQNAVVNSAGGGSSFKQQQKQQEQEQQQVQLNQAVAHHDRILADVLCIVNRLADSVENSNQQHQEDRKNNNNNEKKKNEVSHFSNVSATTAATAAAAAAAGGGGGRKEQEGEGEESFDGLSPLTRATTRRTQHPADQTREEEEEDEETSTTTTRTGSPTSQSMRSTATETQTGETTTAEIEKREFVEGGRNNNLSNMTSSSSVSFSASLNDPYSRAYRALLSSIELGSRF